MTDTRDLEDRLTRSLHAAARDTPDQPLRPLELHSSSTDLGPSSRRWTPALLTAAAVAAIAAVAIFAMPGKHQSTQTSSPLAPGQIQLDDGLRVTPPAGLTFHRLPDLDPKTYTGYCVSSSAPVGADCSKGILVWVATPGGFVPGGPPQMCSNGATIPTATSTNIAGLPAELWTIRCGDSATTSGYWWLAAQTLMVQQPLDGTLATQAQELVDSIDVEQWTLRTITPPVAETSSEN